MAVAEPLSRRNESLLKLRLLNTEIRFERRLTQSASGDQRFTVTRELRTITDRCPPEPCTKKAQHHPESAYASGYLGCGTRASVGSANLFAHDAGRVWARQHRDFADLVQSVSVAALNATNVGAKVAALEPRAL